MEKIRQVVVGVSTAVHNQYPTTRIGGLWFMVVGLTMILSVLLSRDYPINVPLFVLGYTAGVGGILMNRSVRARLATGSETPQQRRVVNATLAFLGILLVLAFRLLGRGDPRILWLVILIAVGLHLLPFSVVHGPADLLLGMLCILNGVTGLWLTVVPFVVFGLIDGVLKLTIGAWLFFAAREQRGSTHEGVAVQDQVEVLP